VVGIPAFVWRGGFVFRALITGIGAGGFLGALAWIDSGRWLAGLAVFVILALACGTWAPLRMARYWPAGAGLDGPERVAVVRAARTGRRIGDPRLRAGAQDYAAGMRAAADNARMWRPLIVFLLAVAVVVAVWDTLAGTWGNAVASAVYLVLLVLEVFWWPRRQAQLLADADRACG
jgi:hypothetical protein